MRHLVSVVLSLVLAPLIYVAAGYSAVKLAGARVVDETIDWGAAGLGAVGALVAGGLFALLVMARLSPMGPVLAGLMYLGVTLWSLLDPAGVVSTMPDRFLGEDNILHAPVGAGTLLLAVPLLVTIFSPRRWRSTAVAAAASYDATPAYPDAIGSAAPTYDSPATSVATDVAAPTYEPPVYTPPTSFPGFVEPGSVVEPRSSDSDAGSRLA